MPVRGPRVLIVDDEATIRQSLRGVLADENYQCTAVEDGEACLAELAREEALRDRLDSYRSRPENLPAQPIQG